MRMKCVLNLRLKLAARNCFVKQLSPRWLYYIVSQPGRTAQSERETFELRFHVGFNIMVRVSIGSQRWASMGSWSINRRR